MNHPNKTFVLDTETDTEFGKRKQFVVVVAKDADTAAQHLKDTLGFKGVANDLTWLMDTNHVTLYDQTGNTPLNVQAKIMYNTVGYYNY